MREAWLPVREFPEHYEVSSSGRVRRTKPYRSVQTGRILKPKDGRGGYPAYCLKISCKAHMRYAHRLVADAFLGPIPSRMEVNHKNGDKSDPRLENLEIISRSANRAHSYQVLGIEPNGARGLRNANATIPFSVICEIRSVFSTGLHTQKELCKMFGVTRPTMSKIVNNQTRLNA